MWTKLLLLSERSMEARIHVRGVPYIAPPLPFPRPHLLSLLAPTQARKPGTWPVPSQVSFLAAFLTRNYCVSAILGSSWMKSPNGYPHKRDEIAMVTYYEHALYMFPSLFLIPDPCKFPSSLHWFSQSVCITIRSYTVLLNYLTRM